MNRQLTLSSSELIRSLSDARSRLPNRTLFVLALAGLRVRLARSLVTLISVILAIAYLSYSGLINALIYRLATLEKEELGAVIGRCKKDPGAEGVAILLRAAKGALTLQDFSTLVAAAGVELSPSQVKALFRAAKGELLPEDVHLLLQSAGLNVKLRDASILFQAAKGNLKVEQIHALFRAAGMKMEIQHGEALFRIARGDLSEKKAETLLSALGSSDELSAIFRAAGRTHDFLLRAAKGNLAPHEVKALLGSPEAKLERDQIKTLTRTARGHLTIAQVQALLGAARIELAREETETLFRAARISHQTEEVNTLLRAAKVNIEATRAGNPLDRWLVAMALLTCAVGIANAMLMSVTERFREIGTMKCLGAEDMIVVKLFLIESSLIGAVGSLLGIILGFILGAVVGLIQFGRYALEYMPYSSILFFAGISVLAGVVLCLIGAGYPAWVAARMRPVEALRVEE